MLCTISADKNRNVALGLPCGYSLSMTDSVDMDALAQRYIDMWQDQLAQISTKPAAPEAWGSVLQNAGQSLGWTPDAIAAFAAAYSVPAQDAAASQRPARTSGATTPAPASGDGGDDPSALLRRLDALERRLAALETDREGD